MSLAQRLVVDHAPTNRDKARLSMMKKTIDILGKIQDIHVPGQYHCNCWLLIPVFFLMVGVANCPLYKIAYYCAGSNETSVSVIRNSRVSTVEDFFTEIRSGISELSADICCCRVSVKQGSTFSFVYVASEVTKSNLKGS